MSKTGDLNAAPSKSARGGCFKRAARKMNCAVLLLIFTVLVDRMPAAYAEESSILQNAQVTEKYLFNPDRYPGNDLIGKGFKNRVAFYGWNPVGDNSAEFQIILQKAYEIKTAFILNYCRSDYGRYYLGSAEMRVGLNREDFTLAN